MASPSYVESAWTAALGQLEGGSREIVLSMNTQLMIGETGVALIAERFGSHIGARPSVLKDPAGDVIRILPPATREPSLLPDRVANNSRAKVAKERMTKVPRPPNAFMLYRQFHHPHVKAENPGMHNNDISVEIGKQWRDEDALTRSCFQKKADELKRKHHEDHPDYQYQPRKASEKKRRMTKAKAARPGQDSSSPSPPETSSYQQGSETMLPDFTISDDGKLKFHDVDGSQQGQFRAMIAKHNLSFLASQVTSSNAPVQDMQFTAAVADEHVYDQSLINWQELDLQRQTAHEQDLQAYQVQPHHGTKKTGNKLYDQHYDSGTHYNALINQYFKQILERQAAIHKELSGVPRDQWPQTWDQIPAPQNSAAPTVEPPQSTASQTLFPNLTQSQSSFDSTSTILRHSPSAASFNNLDVPSAFLNFDEEGNSAPEGYKPATNGDLDWAMLTREFTDIQDLPLDWYNTE